MTNAKHDEWETIPEIIAAKKAYEEYPCQTTAEALEAEIKTYERNKADV